MTTSRINFEQINALALAQLPSLVEQWFPDGKRVGNEYKIGDIYGSPGDSLSINLDTGLWADFAGDDRGGDPVSLYAAMTSKSQIDAARELAEILGAGAPIEARTAPAKPKPKSDKPQWTPVLPVPDDAPGPSFRHRAYGEPARVWTYRDAEGRVLGYVCRFDMPDGGKEVIPRTFCDNGKGRREWRWLSFAKPRPLYGLDEIAKRPNAQVIICEGEKATDAARELFPAAVVVSWAGGGKAVKHADWSALAGRKVVIWPDWDRKTYKKGPRAGEIMPVIEQPGIVAALDIAAQLDGIAEGVRIALPPEPRDDLEDGWDAADALAEGWTPERARDWIKSALLTANELRERFTEQPAADEPPLYDDSEIPDYGPAADYEPEEMPFLCLGYDHGRYYYLPRGARHVTEIAGKSHGPSSLLMLAPLQWWQRNYPGTNNKPDWTAAANALMRLCERAGPYDPTRVRGRGAWWDNGTAVLHLGDRLAVNGEERPLDGVKGRFIYEAKPPMRVAIDNPLSNAEAHQLVEICQMLPWERPISALLLAGWCVVAPICGALRWRPHIWLTGPAGSGKTWVFENILRRALGETALAVQSETTEAGLRQTLALDARPVVFDEAEGEDARAQARIQNVLALMRGSSSESGAAIIKGQANGSAIDYRIRSCFAFASIGVGLQQHADHTRVSVLSLMIDYSKPVAERQKQFETLQRRWSEIMTPEFVERLHARAIQLVPIIRQNAETFAVAGASVIGTRRLGDQIGALLAGAYALHSSRAITLDEATRWIEAQDWSEQAAIQEHRDEYACLQRLMEHVARVQGDDGPLDMSIGELVARAAGEFKEGISPSAAEDALLRLGFKLEVGMLLISNTASAIARILANTAWAKNWAGILRRIDGAEPTQPKRFGPGVQTRAVAIPLEIIVERK